MYAYFGTLPVGTSLYTVYITADPEGTARSQMTCEEVDVLAPSRASWGTVASEGRINGRPQSRIVDDYGMDVRIIGVVNQSDGYVAYDAFAAGDEQGANDL